MWLDWHSQGCGGGDHKLTRGRHYACSIAAALPLLFCHCKIPNVVHSRLSLSDFLKWLCRSSSFLKLYFEENYWNLWNVSNFQNLSSNRRQIARLCFQWRAVKHIRKVDEWTMWISISSKSVNISIIDIVSCNIPNTPVRQICECCTHCGRTWHICRWSRLPQNRSSHASSILNYT